MNDIFEEIEKKEKKLYEQLTTSPLVEVSGIVGLSGVGAAKTENEELWSLRFTFDAWRIGNDSMQTEPMRLQRKIADGELRQYQDEINSETIIKIQARVALENVPGTPQGLFEQVLEKEVDDEELQNYLQELQKPIVYTDDFFGTCTYDRKYGCYNIETKWNNESIHLSLDVEDPSDFQTVVATAHKLWKNETIWNGPIKDFAVQELFELKNDSWLDDDEEELTSDQFKECMVLETISLDKDGSFEFWYDDGDLFWGHTILISGTLEEGFTDAEIAG